MLTRLRPAASDGQSDMRPTLRDMMRNVTMKCTTRRDMGVQEVMHLLLQVPSVDHDLEFLRARSETISIELVDDGANGGLVGRRDLLQAYALRMQDDAWALTASGRPPLRSAGACRSLRSTQNFRFNNRGRLVSHTRTTRLIMSCPTFSSNPRSCTYLDYCRNILVRADLGRAPCTRGGVAT